MTPERKNLGAGYYWLTALWWLLLLIHFPFAMMYRALEVTKDFTYTPVYRVGNILYNRRKAAGRIRR